MTAAKTPAVSPPPSRAHPAQSSGAIAPPPLPSPPHPIPPTMVESTKTEANGDPQASSSSDGLSRIPRVRLDVNTISDMMAARLATSLVGHILFLKNQVPFPVMQLARIPSHESNTRASKKRNELISSFDTLSSHLITTFTSLSTALARSTSLNERPSDATCPEAQTSTAAGKAKDPMPAKKTGRGYLVILIGPSVSSARSKIVFAVDGLELKVWGVRDELTVLPPDRVENEEERSEEDKTTNDESSSEDELSSEPDEECDASGGESEREPSGGEDEEDDTNDESSGEDESVSSSDEDQESEMESDGESPQSPPSPEPPHHHVQAYSLASTLPSSSYMEEQQALRIADRLLSRTLATADGEGNGMASEMAPTQTHIVLHAPRRFAHPSWVPRQNLSRSLDRVLREFLEASGVREEGIGGDEQKRTKVGSQVEGVWVSCKAERGIDVTNGSESVPEADEMIWWSWEGKLLGFEDW